MSPLVFFTKKLSLSSTALFAPYLLNLPAAVLVGQISNLIVEVKKHERPTGYRVNVSSGISITCDILTQQKKTPITPLIDHDFICGGCPITARARTVLGISQTRLCWREDKKKRSRYNRNLPIYSTEMVLLTAA